MNIKEAKEQIKNSMRAYFLKDEYGNHQIPIERQRPIFLIGAPGIGKTAIMKQISQELEVGLVSYSMTHHTRQSALGLPHIVQKKYGDKEYAVSEYTMSEIIASVYDAIESTGLKEGILFLDEINCVSETLAPSMLQFLQYKVFGRHRVPDGWIVVTAGNPPEYNKSVREFDIATWDRLKQIQVEPEHGIWKEYAYKKGTHASIIAYLDIKKSNFYLVETGIEGKRFVTPRGWDDLSEMIMLYEKQAIKVDEHLIRQYLQHSKIAKDFAVFYDLFNKYKSDYQIGEILAGNASADIQKRAKEARFDERIALLSLLLEAMTLETREIMLIENTHKSLAQTIGMLKPELKNNSEEPALVLEKRTTHEKESLHKSRHNETLSLEDIKVKQKMIQILEAQHEMLRKSQVPVNADEALKIIKKDFEKRIKEKNNIVTEVGLKLNHMLQFVENVFGEGQELLILITELTIDYYCAQYIGRFGCQQYFSHSKVLQLHERHNEIIREIENL